MFWFNLCFVFHSWKCILFDWIFQSQFQRFDGGSACGQMVHDSGGSRFPQSFFLARVLPKEEKIFWIFCDALSLWTSDLRLVVLKGIPVITHRMLHQMQHLNFMFNTTEGWAKFISFFLLINVQKNFKFSVCLMRDICLSFNLLILGRKCELFLLLHFVYCFVTGYNLAFQLPFGASWLHRLCSLFWVRFSVSSATSFRETRY